MLAPSFPCLLSTACRPEPAIPAFARRALLICHPPWHLLLESILPQPWQTGTSRRTVHVSDPDGTVFPGATAFGAGRSTRPPCPCGAAAGKDQSSESPRSRRFSSTCSGPTPMRSRYQYSRSRCFLGRSPSPSWHAIQLCVRMFSFLFSCNPLTLRYCPARRRASDARLLLISSTASSRRSAPNRRGGTVTARRRSIGDLSR
jgi:hypothetical protein